MVVAALTGCTDTSPATSVDTRLQGLRAAASLQDCPPALPAVLPDIELACLGGGPSVRRGDAPLPRPLLVNVWATWCQPCVREVPELVELQAAAEGQVDVLGVLTQDEPASALEFARQLSMRYPSVVDEDGRVMRAFSSGPPVTLFLAADGTLQHVQRGEIKSATALRALVRQHLGVEVPEGASS